MVRGEWETRLWTMMLFLLLIAITVQVNCNLEEQPNFIILFVDDWGWGDLGSNWKPSAPSTPRLDEISEKSTRFIDMHAGASVCTPSRAALLTGRLGLRTGVVRNFDPFSVAGLPLNETTIAEMLKQNGYRTGMQGKWHLGMTHKYHPSSRGFDDFFGLPMSEDYGCSLLGNAWDVKCPGNLTNPCPSCHDNPNSQEVPCNDGWPNGWDESIPLFEGYNIIEQPCDISTLTRRYVDHAQTFIENSVKDGVPFFLYTAFAHMHKPITHESQWTNVTGLGPYADALYELDHHIGRLFDFLSSSKAAKNTLMLIVGDNGPPENQCQFSGSPGPFTGEWQRHNGGGSTGKSHIWEGGHREVGLAYWDGVIPAGRVSKSIVSTLDFLPTLASLSHTPLPPDRDFDGEDISEILFGKENTSRNLFHPNSAAGVDGDIHAVRVGQFKAVLKSGGGKPACGGQKAPGRSYDPWLIFDLESDWAEANPLNSNDSRYSVALEEAKKAYFKLLNSVKHDNTSQTDYSQDRSVKACCNPDHIACQCKC